MEVVQVRWPSEAAKRTVLLAAGTAVLLLVESEEPPEMTSPFEDWIRIPTSEADINVRVNALRLRAGLAEPQSPFAPEGPPRLDDAGIARFGHRWVSLSPVEARLLGALLERPGSVVPRQQMIAAGWPTEDGSNGAPTRNALDAQVLRMRRRLQPLGLTIRTVRARGYILDRIAADPSSEV